MEINKETATLYNKAIFIIELHYQYVGSVWMAEDKSEFVATNQSAYQYDGEAPKGDDFDEWVEYSSHDLRAMPMLSLDEAIDYVEYGKEGANELYQLLSDYDFLEEETQS